MAKEEIVYEVVSSAGSKDGKQQIRVKDLNLIITEGKWSVKHMTPFDDECTALVVLERETGITL